MTRFTINDMHKALDPMLHDLLIFASKHESPADLAKYTVLYDLITNPTIKDNDKIDFELDLAVPSYPRKYEAKYAIMREAVQSNYLSNYGEKQNLKQVCATEPNLDLIDERTRGITIDFKPIKIDQDYIKMSNDYFDDKLVKRVLRDYNTNLIEYINKYLGA